ncbi:MAG TPA: hypothetical protein VKA37_11560 [Halobacteriales archaeon]|nr:hypothetical protein [Halobacteriales archaeon]
MDVDLPTQGLRDHWEDVEADLEATAAELEGEGWTTVTLHAGDVTTRSGRDGGAAGLDVLAPGNEFEDLLDQVEAGAAFTETAVFRQAAGGVAFLVCVLRDPDRRVAVLVPAFYPQTGEDAQALAEHAHDVGQVELHVRPLQRDRVVTFTVDDPELVFPES